MEPWRQVWREGLVPQLPLKGLEALRAALQEDDMRLMQGGTCIPQPVRSVNSYPVVRACAIGYCCWHNGNLLVSELSDAFSRVCFSVDVEMQRAGLQTRDFVDWFDRTPRARMRALLLPEVELALAANTGVAALTA